MILVPDENGCFMVRSCYRKLQGEIDATYESFWRKLWGMKIPGKGTLFMACMLLMSTYDSKFSY